MEKEYEMEGNMLERNADIKLILGKVRSQMTNLLVNTQCGPVLRNGEGSRTGSRLFFGNPLYIRNTPYVAQV